MSGSVVSSDWTDDGFATGALPLVEAALFPETDLNVVPDEEAGVAYTEFAVADPQLLAGLLTETSTMSVALEDEPGSTMAQIFSLDAYTLAHSPQLAFWITASVQSLRPGVDAIDSVLSIALRPSEDCYRFERDGATPVPTANTMLLAAGDARRAYFKIERFDIDGVAVDGEVPQDVTVNSALLEMDVAEWVAGSPDLTPAFRPYNTVIQLHLLSEQFDSDSASQNRLEPIGRGNIAGAGFDVIQGSGSSDSTRVFQIADVLERWWHGDIPNNGLAVSLIGEDWHVNAIEIEDMRLVVIVTTQPTEGE